MVKLPFTSSKKERKPVKWVLKAKPSDSDSWEDIEEYTEEKTYSDLKDIIDDLRSQGYESVRLDAYDKDNRFIRHVFVRTFGLNKQISQFKSIQKTFMDVMSNQMTLFNEMLRTQTELIKSLSDVKKQLSEGSPTFVDGISQFLYFKELEKQLYETLGITPDQAKSNPMIERLLYEVVFDMIKKYMPDIEKKIKEKLNTQQHENTQTPPITQTISLPLQQALTPKPPPPIKVPPEIENKINDILNKVEYKVMPPCLKEKCEEAQT